MDDIDRELAERAATAYDDNGVDRSLIRASLARTPTERLISLENFLQTLATARRILTPVGKADARAKTDS